jgi:hypothetical protein
MDRNILIDGTIAPAPDPREMAVVKVLLSGLAALTLFFTLLHHAFPEVLDVPSIAGVYMNDKAGMFVMDVGVMGLAWMCFRHAWRRIGLYAATIFLAGSFVFTGIEESMWILLGRWSGIAPAVIPAASGEGLVANGSYYFTRGFFWFLETPVTACLGWFFLAYSTVYMAGIILPRAWVVARAALGAFLATNVDMWVDPVQTHPRYTSWVWLTPPGGLLLFGIPLTNFIGWFLLIFLFAILFERLPGLVKRRGLYAGSLIFFGWLVALELCILVSFLGYTFAERALFHPALNLTLWGIGS